MSQPQTVVQLHRANTTAEANGYTGPEGEMIVDLVKKVGVIQDGATAGGFPMARQTVANVMEYGAVGNGAANDNAAILAAIAAAAAAGPNPIVYFPAGIYPHTSLLHLTAGMRFIGAGSGKSILWQQTASTGSVLIDSISNCGVENLGFIGQSASVIALRCNSDNCWNTRLRNLEIQGMGAAGIGIDLRGTAGIGFVGWTSIENVVVGGGNVASWGTKIGMLIGKADGSPHVVRTTIIGGRVWRTHTGILCDNCDTTRGYGCSFDDIDGNEIEFNATNATQNKFLGATFEPDGVPAKYVEFNGSGQNYVDEVPENATPTQVHDTGSNNGWQGSDGSGGLYNKVPNPQRFTGIANFPAGFGFVAGDGGAVVQITSKSTNVTLNKWSGKVTTTADNLAAGDNVGFNILNSLVGADDIIVNSTGLSGYNILTAPNGPGAIACNIRNVTGGDLAQAIEIRFMVIKSTTS